MISVTWVKSTSNTWLPLQKVDLTGVIDEGVYVIWVAGQRPNVVRVGQGDIANRLTANRADPKVLAYATQGQLLVTWAIVLVHLRDGVERYLAEYYHPRIGDVFPDVAPIAVNLVV